jgi:hypothetical protein
LEIQQAGGDPPEVNTVQGSIISPTADAQARLCPHCGQPIAPAGLHLPPIKQRILDTVRRRPGISAEQLRCAVWADDGGPECRHTIFVHVAQLNAVLQPHGICVRSEGGDYRIRVRTVP